MRWRPARQQFVPVLLFLVMLAGLFLLDRRFEDRVEVARREAALDAERQASLLANATGNVMSSRLGALTGSELTFAPVGDSALAQALLMQALDSLTVRLAGVTAVSAIFPDGRLIRGSTAMLGRPGVVLGHDTAVTSAYERAVRTRQPAATGVLDLLVGRRVILFESFPGDSTAPFTMALAAELDPNTLVRAAMTPEVTDSLAGSVHTIYGPNGVRLTLAVPGAARWPSVTRRIPVADTEWTVEMAYPPVDARTYRIERIALWLVGLTLALSFSMLLYLGRATIQSQRKQLELRMAAEQAARASAAEAQERAREARELASQVEAATRAAERLSTSLDPDDVVELFLGTVAESLGADIAALYVLSEEGDVLEGRRRIVFRQVPGITERLEREDIRQVRAPAAILPGLADAVATGDPVVLKAREDLSLPRTAAVGEPSDASMLALPLLIGGRPVGVASWEMHGKGGAPEPGVIAFAQALAAPAAAALRTAELFAAVERERSRAAREAARFGAVLDQLADGVLVVNARGMVERWSRVAEELLGPALRDVPVAEWPGRLALTSSDRRPLHAAEFPLLRALRGERVMRASFSLARGPGQERHIACSAGPIETPDGEQAGAAMVLRDVTDEQQYAEMLRHTNLELRRQAEIMEDVNRQLRDATKAKDRFLAVMSHELRTPINAIMGYTDLLDLGVKGPLNEQQLQMVGRVRDTSRHLLGLINELLDLEKIGSGQLQLTPRVIDVGSVVRDAAEQIAPLVSAKRLKFYVEDGRPITVLADRTRLTQVLLNLLSNAAKFTPAGSVHVRYDGDTERVRIYVRDTGTGIARDQFDRIFEEFYQVDGGLSRSAGGTGLGLAIARKFTRMMGGEILVQSEPGQGAEFIVDLPAMAGEPAEDAEAEVFRSDPTVHR